MNLIKLAVELDNVINSGKSCLIYTDPEFVDFTKTEFCFNLNIISNAGKLVIPINRESFLEILSILKAAIFENKEISIFGWNLKSLFSASMGCLGSSLQVEARFLDLKVAEVFQGIHEVVPTCINEVLVRTKKLVSDSSWERFKGIYQKVYLPLIIRVIPAIETEGVINTQNRTIVYPCYDLTGQINGRLSCHMLYERCFNPHSLAPDLRANLLPRQNGYSFLSFDYCHNEVSVLAWLSQDVKLKEMLAEGDFYENLYRKLKDSVCDAAGRSFCKSLFLPVVYGQSPTSLAHSLGIGNLEAESLINRLKKLFQELFGWVENYPNCDWCSDYFGRKRYFEVNERYKYRNFIVQSPAAILCLEKLVVLHDKIRKEASLVASIHDGYIICAKQANLEMIRYEASKVLESESSLFEGLKLKVDININKTL